MTFQLARSFLDLLWLNGTLNSGQTCNTHSRTKNEASSMSLPWWQCVAVEWNGTTQGTSRNEPSKVKKIHSVLGRAWYTDKYTDVYNIVACTCIIHMRVCAIVRWCRLLQWILKFIKFIISTSSIVFVELFPDGHYCTHSNLLLNDDTVCVMSLDDDSLER